VENSIVENCGKLKKPLILKDIICGKLCGKLVEN